jgi:hypothetical protein
MAQDLAKSKVTGTLTGNRGYDSIFIVNDYSYC